MRRLVLILLAVMTVVTIVAIPQRNAKRINRDRQKTTQQIKDTSRKIDENALNVERQLNQLNTVTAEIKDLNLSIGSIKKSVDSLGHVIDNLNDSIDEKNRNLRAMQEKYAIAARKMQSHKEDMSTMAFVFSAKTFSQAYRRMRYLKQFSQWRERKSADIKAEQAQLEERRKQVEVKQKEKNEILIRLNVARRDLEKKQKENETLLASLKKEGSALKKILKRKEREAQALDEELERFIAEEQRQAEERRKAEERRLAEENKKREREERERQKQLALEKQKKQEAEQRKSNDKPVPKKDVVKDEQKVAPVVKENSPQEVKSEKQVTPIIETPQLSGTFESNKGRLPYPVSGRYKIVRGFGVQQHPELKYVKTNNGGIDIEVAPGGEARAIFNGRVSAIFKQPGFNTIVMIRHGSYITIYANLGSISVKKGDEIKAGQTIGRIYSDPDDRNRSVLHFEIRNEKKKLNPELWIK